MIMGVVADDITGANDIGIMVAKAGYTAHVYAYAEPGTLARAPHTEKAGVLILDTNSRLDAPSVAYSKVFAATRELEQAGCTRFYNKTCSVFRGNIGVEFDAMLDALGESFAVVVLGFPKNGRQTIDGVQYVHGERLEASEFRNDPMHPMTRSNLIEILQAQTARTVGLVTHEVIAQGAVRLGERIEEMRSRCHYLILDVPDQAALATIARAVRQVRVLCGSSALAEELPAVWEASPTPALPVAVPPDDGVGVLCVAGSLMPQTAAQIHHLRTRGTLVRELDTLELFEPAARERQQAPLVEALSRYLVQGEDVLLHASNDPQVVERTRTVAAERGLVHSEVGRLVSGTLAAIAKEVAERTRVNRLVIAGGETSAALCASLGVTGMRVWREIQPGLPSCLSLDEPPRLLVLKSGSFGSTDFLEQAIAHLKSQ